MKEDVTSLLQRKVNFMRKYWAAPGGVPFEIPEDGWLLTEFLRPLHSFRLTAVDKERLCDACAGAAGELVQEYARPKCAKCAGLRCEPIQFVLLDLPRRSGKTTGTSGYVAASLFRGEDERIAFISGSEDQSSRLFTEHYALPIAENSALAKRSRVLGTKISSWETPGDMRKGKAPACTFTFTSTSISGATGGRFTVIVIDEARAVPSDVAAALLPTIWDANGWCCPRGVRGHTKTRGDLDDPRHPAKCATCGAELQPWVGKLLAMSSAGEITGGLRDWFFELCDARERVPHPRVHVYRAQGVINRKVAESSVNATGEVFGDVESMRDSISIETSNQSRRRGEQFLSHNDIAACVDYGLSNHESGERPGVAFLDTSDTIDSTSMVWVEDDSHDGEDAWTRVVVARVDVWDPKKVGRIDDRELEAFLDVHAPLFKLLRLRIDDRHAPWVRNLVARLKRKPWGRIVMGCTEYTREERRFAWNELERRFMSKTIRVPDHSALRRELIGARKTFDLDNRMDVREAGSRNKTGVRHLDIAESLAGCCFDVHSLASARQGSLTRVRSLGKEVESRMRSTPTRRYGPESY